MYSCGVLVTTVLFKWSKRFRLFETKNQDLATYKRVVAVVISISVLSTFLRSMEFWIPPNIRSLVCYCHWSSSITTLGLHKDLFRRKTKQIQAQQVQNAALTGDTANFASLLQSARFVYISYFWLLFANRYLFLLQLQSTAWVSLWRFLFFFFCPLSFLIYVWIL